MDRSFAVLKLSIHSSNHFSVGEVDGCGISEKAHSTAGTVVDDVVDF